MRELILAIYLYELFKVNGEDTMSYIKELIVVLRSLLGLSPRYARLSTTIILLVVKLLWS